MKCLSINCQSLIAKELQSRMSCPHYLINMTYPETYPLVVDLDGTLIHTDMLHESVIALLRQNPIKVFSLPFWLMRGKAFLKRSIAEHSDMQVESLPFNHALIEYLQQEKARGRKLVLCTASDSRWAAAIADQLQIFDEVYASDGLINLSQTRKAEKLQAVFGEQGFEYVGNSSDDMPVWKVAKSGVVVNASHDIDKKARGLTHIHMVIPGPVGGLTSWLKQLRIHQWVKNSLLFIPLLAAHGSVVEHPWQILAMAFFSFGFCASSVYLANDLLDLESDRQHLSKRNRPFASGAIPIWKGVIAIPVLLLASLFLAFSIEGDFVYWLLLYFFLTCVYSFIAKRIVLLDCMFLAVLYTLRIVAGAAAVIVPLSFWLLTFSIFLFLSLAFIKRYAELLSNRERDLTHAHGRGYLTSDLPLIQQLGVTSGYAAVLVLALYLNSDNVLMLYSSPQWIWGAIPLMLLWLSWMWLQAHRGNMHDDPIVFAIKDKPSLLIGGLFVLVFGLAAFL